MGYSSGNEVVLGATAMAGAGGTVFVVDDDISVREALEEMLSSVGWRVTSFDSASGFLAHPRIQGACCLVLDVGLPDLNGLDLQKCLAVDRAEMPIIFITGDSDVPTSVRAMKAGAVEFLMKPFDDTDLLTAIQSAIERSHSLLGREAELVALRERYKRLSRRECEVMTLIVAGLLNKQVAGELGISEITVKAHRGQVMRKMNARSFADLVKQGTTLGLKR